MTALRFGNWALAFVLAWASASLSFGATNSFDFTYTNREALLADGWSFMATTAGGAQRNTEVTNGAVVSYDQLAHPGVLRIPSDVGDFWGTLNNTRNSLFHNLSSNWVSLRLDVSFAPSSDVQQVQLALYQDDDNYLEVGHAYVSSFPSPKGELVTLVQEDSGVQASWSPRSLCRASVATNRLYLRLDRVPATEQVKALYSLDNTNWSTFGSAWQNLVNPGVCIWASDSGGRLPACDLRRLEIITSDTPLNPLLVAQPQHLVFNAVAGQACTNRQQVRVVARRSPAAQGFAVTSNVPWLLAFPVVTNTPGYCDVGVDTAGLGAGTYQGTVTVSAPGATAAETTVTLIVNPAVRAQVATWRGANAGAMSVWVDDSYPSGYEELSTNGFHGTYLLWGETSQRYTNASMLAVPAEFTSFSQAGMELGCHTVDHWYEQLLSETGLRFEIESNMAAVVTKTPQASNALIAFAFPGGQAPIPYRVIGSDYFLAVHGYNQNQLEDPNPYDFTFLKCFNSHEHVPAPPPDYKAVVDAAIAQGRWFNVVLHGLNNTDGAIAYAKGKDIWVGPGGVVAKYIQQRQRTVITNYQESAGQIAFSYSRLPLEASAVRDFEVSVTPQDRLSFQVDLSGLNAAYAVQIDGVPVTSAARAAEGRAYVVFDAPVTTNAHSAILQAVANRAPVLPAQPLQTVSQFAPLVVTNTALDPDLPFQSITYSLLSGPAGAQVNPQGVVQWTPGAMQGPGTYVVTMMTTDNGSPSLSTTNSFSIQVLPQSWLVLPSQPPVTLASGDTLMVTNTALYTRPSNPWFTNTVLFSYTNREALLADGWSFYATTPGQGQRNTEVTTGAVVSYDQVAHPGTLWIPCDVGDLWGVGNNFSRNALFRSLPANWMSAQLGLGFAPSLNVQQVQLALYQDDDNYVQAGMAYNSANLGGEAATVILETNGQPVNAFTSVYALTNFYLRLERLLTGTNVTASYSPDGVSWTAIGSYRSPFASPRLSIWTGGSPVPWTNGLPNVELRRLEVTVSNAIVPVLNYALVDPPPGATVDANGVIHWSPAQDQSPGTYVLTMIVSDLPLSGDSIATTNSFTVTVLPTNTPPVLGSVSRQADGSILLVGAGIAGRVYWVQASTNLVNWTTISTNAADTNGQLALPDPNASVYPARYYRLFSP